MVAITSRLPSRWCLAELATPTPPTSRAVRPTSVRYWENRSMLRSSCGVALLRVRISQPASGLSALAASAGSPGRGCPQRFVADEQARAEADAAGELVWLARQHRAQLDGGGAQGY